jgi:NADH:ubiquinone oxidoreductase subunit 4 (subunit M)
LLLPLASEAPTIGSVMLAAVLLKMETYGFIRFSLPLFPDASVYFTGLMAFLALLAIIYTAMIAYAQEDMKQMIAYSSISHMGVITLGVFALNIEGIAGAVYLMIGHGIVSDAMSVPVLANITEFGATPLFTTEELASVGIAMVLYPLSAFRAMNKAALNVYQELKDKGTQEGVISTMQTRMELYDMLNYHAYEQKMDELFSKGKAK